ncbi:transcriptional repressor [Corynebacterium sp. ES2794-CONJ1]|uniref:Fur family transcriptional regulator n=1 Tax=unclassified Corynebacterium TaxID=2624378 RepID=UPI00216A8149|nr:MULTISPECIES: Fur family transcriptional regulator [unclassified Corynebacterium]MCS4490589.1 transcriptional repressor [Corynebacterium sp. ES2775-CONJ]MCS4492368.1 transcriptional repressor [Corynebacterium sp. ES2715-CONJ3]MCS4532440.1 transcriptional repressor [Corynebacterium sp. ES2730-CONJ]MCU9519835.1 transcriptional repressor [Corynebacterium sp. ES2794-CONJ1]
MNRTLEPRVPKLGVRSTRQRAAVVTVLRDFDNFASAKTIHEELTKRNLKVGLTTVYRTLQSLTEIKAVDALHMSNGETLYRQCLNNAHHHHLVCTQCGHTVEVEGGPVEEWAKDVSRAHSFTLTGHDAEIYGTCSQCAATI